MLNASLVGTVTLGRTLATGLALAVALLAGCAAGPTSNSFAAIRPMYDGERLPVEQVSYLQAGHGAACSSRFVDPNGNTEARCSRPPRLKILTVNGRPFPSDARRVEVPAGDVVVDLGCTDDPANEVLHRTYHLTARALYELAAMENQKMCLPYLLGGGRLR